LKVTIALARPFIAVSKTMSSFGSDSLGRQRKLDSRFTFALTPTFTKGYYF
jgi:hypothetical protein